MKTHAFCFRGRPSSLSALLLIVGTALAGCGGGDEAPAAASPSSASATAPATASPVGTAPATASVPAGQQTSATSPAPGTPPVAPAVPPVSVANRAPTIGGTPQTTLAVGGSYSFIPVVTDADGDTLGFTITNKPAWATFNTSTGKLSGTPTLAHVGSSAGIVITVSDGKTTTSLGAFAINVTQIATGNATLSWTPPTQNTDGTALTNLSGFRVYYGTNANSLTQSINVTNASISTYVVEGLSPATWYFAVKAVAGGVESNLSNVASKTIS